MPDFFAPCPRGLEAVLVDELHALGAPDPRVTPGGVAFAGDWPQAYRANLESRIASRVLWKILEAPYRNETEIYDAVRALPWPEYFGARARIRVDVGARRCPLKSLDFITLRIKDAVCDRFRAERGRRPDVDTVAPDVRVHAFLDERRLSLYLDTSGEALFKRGHRAATVEAPLRENLAAGILKLSGWRPEEPFLDPMCGSGTFLIEAVQAALGVAPGLGREFALKNLHTFDPRLWETAWEAARARRREGIALAVFGRDHSEAALAAARANLQAAGLDRAVTLEQADVLTAGAPAPEGVLIANPPYGVRLGEQQELAAFYPRLGDALKQGFAGWRAYLFTADPRLAKGIGLHASRRTPLFNGALECRLFEFRLYAGSQRRDRTKAEGQGHDAGQ